MTDPITFRQYTAADRKACISIFQSNVPEYFDPIELGGFELWLDGQDEGTIKYKTSVADFYYVAEYKDEIIACGGWYIMKDKKSANMAWGMVHNQLHAQGFGKRLLLFRIEQIQQMFPSHAIVMDTSQHTYQFYERLGFSVTKIVNDAYAPGLHRYDMEKIN